LIRLTLKPGREASVLRRHPWVFSGAVGSHHGDGTDGIAEVADAGGRAMAHGAYSRESQIRARLWTFDGRLPDLDLFRERFRAARRLREEVVPAGTTGYRAVNSEGDLCPGVVADVYGGSAVLDLTTEGTEVWEAGIEGAFRDAFSPNRVVVRRSAARHDSGRRPSPLRPDPFPGEEEADRVPFDENGLHFLADVSAGQKTGFFLDQRENRARLRAMAAGRSMLNLFSYSGAFSVAALAGGARRAVDVDSSEAALALAREHRGLNGFRADEPDFARADVFEDLRRRVAGSESWDLVVCDPPALAKKRGDVDRAARAYKDVNRLAMSLVSSGGFLLSCSCSGLVPAELFQKIVFSASLEARATFAIVARQGAGPDHPVSLDCPEGEYLKGLWLRKT
jgi:23S rRNA (cytosine1962-C5)-methyltransferase